MKAISSILIGIIFLAAVTISPCFAQQQVRDDAKTVEQLYPNLVAGILTYAKGGVLQDGVLLKTADIQIAQSDIDAGHSKTATAISAGTQEERLFCPRTGNH